MFYFVDVVVQTNRCKNVWGEREKEKSKTLRLVMENGMDIAILNNLLRPMFTVT